MYASLIYRIILTYIGQFVIMDNYSPAWWGGDYWKCLFCHIIKGLFIETIRLKEYT